MSCLYVMIILVLSSASLAMDIIENHDALVVIELSEQPETTGKTNCISSLQSWKDFAKQHTLLDGYEVLPQAVAEFQQAYEIKSNFPISQAAIDAWLAIQNMPEYQAEVLRMHTWLVYGNDTYKDTMHKNNELVNLKNFCIKKAYEQLSDKEKRIRDLDYERMKIQKWALGSSVSALVFL